MEKHNPASDRMLKFVTTFNETRFMESHEILEEVWRGTTGEKKTLYHGLIQVAVALHHWQKGNSKGAEYEWEKAKEKLAYFLDKPCFIDIGSLWEDVENYKNNARMGCTKEPPQIKEPV